MNILKKNLISDKFIIFIYSLFLRIEKKALLINIKKKNKVGHTVLFGNKVEIFGTKITRFAEGASVRNSTIGEYFSIGRYSKITNTTIGKFCSISWDVTINAIGHLYENLSTNAFPYVKNAGDFLRMQPERKIKEVKIGNDVWIGANSVIMPGINIGDGAVIGAETVVTKDVPLYAIVAGVPAKVIKYRFDKKTIERLLKIKWWDKDRTFIKNISLWQQSLSEKVLRDLER